MIPISHLLSSIFILRIITIFFPTATFNFQTILLSMGFQILPDLDIFRAKKLNSHHVTYFHSPLFWIIIFTVLFVFNQFFSIVPIWLILLFIIQVLMHLFFDFMTGRAAGIPLLYPFIKKEFSILPLNKNHGNFKPFSLKDEIKFLKYYLKSKSQILFELTVWILGIISLLV
mgnify:CR=1 FL=1